MGPGDTSNVASISARRSTATTSGHSVTLSKVTIDAIVRRLQRVHEALGGLPLDGLEVKCGCGAALRSGASRLAVDAVIELEVAIEALLTSKDRAAALI